MSGPTVVARHAERGVMLIWGGETFYGPDDILITWDTEVEAVEWLNENHPELRYVAQENIEAATETAEIEIGKVRQAGLWDGAK